MDRAWWNHHKRELDKVFTGDKVSVSKVSGVKYLKNLKCKNSGQGAILYAYSQGAERIILLGFDAQPTDGQSHWHGDHPKPLTNPSAFDRWQIEFAEAAKRTSEIEVINASRETALRCWPREDLESALSFTASKQAFVVSGMHGVGDTLHERAVVRELKKNGEVWIHTPFPSLFWDMPEVRVLRKNSDLPPQARNERQESDLFDDATPPTNARQLRIQYDRAGVLRHGSVLAAMSAKAGVATGDFRLEAHPDWLSQADELLAQWKPDKSLMFYRPVIDRVQHKFCAKRNPDHKAYTELIRSIREQFFVVSIADSTTEKIVCHGIEPDVDKTDGSLTMAQIYGLMAHAELAFGPVSFATILAQALGTPGITVFGGFESSLSFAAGAKLTPWLGIDPVKPCNCWNARHRCDKQINMPQAIERIKEFIGEHVENIDCRQEVTSAA
ncbi:hypothetical protein [Orrella sp. 11846]|uniref:hypothetical protein n=1 Tax=Orrella sp. 11846 TaxID=3409913 RepID=UPI003B5C8C9A